MESTYQFLLSLGGILLIGQIISTLGRRTVLPRVTLLLFFGIVIGNEALNIIPPVFTQRFEIIAEMTLMMVGFLIGGKLTTKLLKTDISKMLWISVSSAVFTALFVSLGLLWVGLPLELAVILGCIASATAPAATLDVVTESNEKSHFSKLLVSVVALDDAWALILFGVGVAMASSIAGDTTGSSFVYAAFKDIGGAIILGVFVGFPAAFLTGRLKPGEPILTEALGLVFICGGLAIWLDVSFLIASITMGAIIANFAKHHDYPFHAIENIEWPFMVIFFVLAGATIDLELMSKIGIVGSVYILCRISGKIIGARIGCQLSNAEQKTKSWIGVALLPQAGVSIGMALVAASRFPEHQQILLSIIMGSTIFFELIGPLLTKIAIQRAHSNSFNQTPKDGAV